MTATYSWPEQIKEFRPEIGIVLGSGLGGLVDHMQIEGRVSFSDIPLLRPSTAPGHTGAFVFGRLGTKRVVAQQGRLHYYEGYSPEEIVMPIRLMKTLGVHTLILSNAAGAINTNFKAGELMRITDHINFMGINPLVGPNPPGLERFPDMTYGYDPELGQLLMQTASDLNIPLKEGVYIATSGPSYETPAEIRAFRTWGADAVGMSTVPEVILANQLAMRVLAISCLSNMAAGILAQRLSEEEVLAAGQKVEETLVKLITAFLASLESRI